MVNIIKDDATRDELMSVASFDQLTEIIGRQDA
jgi:hypothetical protein